MDRKKINRGFKKLRVWQDAVDLYILACRLFANFPFELKKVASNVVVIAGTYKNIHAEIVKIDPKNLDPNTEVMRF